MANKKATNEVVSQEMLDENPILVENGVKVGDEITDATEAEMVEMNAKLAAESVCKECDGAALKSPTEYCPRCQGTALEPING